MDYFFKCTVKSISYYNTNHNNGDTYEVSVRPFAEYSVKSGDKVYVAFMPKDEMQNGLLLKCDDEIQIKNGKKFLCLLKSTNNCKIYVEKVGKNGKGDLKLGGLSFRVTKISIEV